jgi:hypothetical protein
MSRLSDLHQLFSTRSHGCALARVIQLQQTGCRDQLGVAVTSFSITLNKAYKWVLLICLIMPQRLVASCRAPSSWMSKSSKSRSASCRMLWQSLPKGWPTASLRPQQQQLPPGVYPLAASAEQGTGLMALGGQQQQSGLPGCTHTSLEFLIIVLVGQCCAS